MQLWIAYGYCGARDRLHTIRALHVFSGKLRLRLTEVAGETDRTDIHEPATISEPDKKG